VGKSVDIVVFGDSFGDSKTFERGDFTDGGVDVCLCWGDGGVGLYNRGVSFWDGDSMGSD